MFKSKLILEPYEVEGRFKLVKPLIYESEVGGLTIFVPCGFDTDGASIPFVLNEFWKIGGTKMPAAVIHDYLYATQILPRDISDSIFLEAMVELGVGEFKRNAMYRAVRLFGGYFYKQYDKRQEKLGRG